MVALKGIEPLFSHVLLNLCDAILARISGRIQDQVTHVPQGFCTKSVQRHDKLSPMVALFSAHPDIVSCMADPQHLDVISCGVEAWNTWRANNPDLIPDLSDAELDGEELSGADFSHVDLREADLSDAILQGVDLREANLREADLSAADLSGSHASGADLSEADLSRAYLGEADFKNAHLSDTDFSGAYFNGADLRHADLSGANLSAAALSGANLSNAIFFETIFADTNLKNAHGLETCTHHGPSVLDYRTLVKSGTLPILFLRGCGLADNFIEYLPYLVNEAIQFYSCFISYNHTDKAFAQRLYDALQGRGVRCWLDEKQLRPGDDIYEEIDRGIRLWDKVLLCCSKDSLTSWWVDSEIGKALAKEQALMKERKEKVLALIPLDLDGYLFDGWVNGKASEIRGRLAANFQGWKRSHAKFEAQMKNVVRALRADDGAREIPPQPKL